MAKSTRCFLSLSLALSDASESGNMRENQALVSGESDWARGYHAENGGEERERRVAGAVAN